MDRNEQIRQRAHQLWEAAGYPDGQEADHWRQAEAEMNEERPLDGNGIPDELADVTALPSGEVLGGTGQADGHVITDEEGGLSDMSDEAQMAVDDPVAQASPRTRQPGSIKP